MYKFASRQGKKKKKQKEGETDRSDRMIDGPEDDRRCQIRK